jgi:hypothetical protein
VVGIEFRPWQWVAFKQIEGEDSNISVAFNVFAQNLEAVIFEGLAKCNSTWGMEEWQTCMHVQCFLSQNEISVTFFDVVLFICYHT